MYAHTYIPQQGAVVHPHRRGCEYTHTHIYIWCTQIYIWCTYTFTYIHAYMYTYMNIYLSKVPWHNHTASSARIHICVYIGCILIHVCAESSVFYRTLLQKRPIILTSLLTGRNVHTHIHTYIYGSISHTYIHTYIYGFIYIYTYIHIWIYIHIYIRTYMDLYLTKVLWHTPAPLGVRRYAYVYRRSV